MGDMSDYYESLFWDEDDLGDDWGYRSKGNKRKQPLQAERFLWRTANGDVLHMRDMTTYHLTNCLQFADEHKTREINEVLSERAKEANNMVPDHDPAPQRNPEYGKAPYNPSRKRLFGDN